MNKFMVFCLLILLQRSIHTKHALVIVPVADLLGQSITTLRPITRYNNLPLCGAKPNSSSGCYRIGQMLFGDMVTILEEKGDEFFISISKNYYITKASLSPQTTYWTAKKNLMPLEQLIKKKVDLLKLPLPTDFKESQRSNQEIATLILPWKDPKTKIVFSAGTRFVVAQKKEDKIEIYILDPAKGTFHTGSVPINDSAINSFQTPHEQRDLFVSILKKWAHLPTGIIPYVWGGASFISSSSCGIIEQKEINESTSIFSIPDFIQPIKTGFDCSGLICSAAQIAGIPYFFKNTYTLAHFLEKIQPHEKLRNGDFIWIPGHVMIVSDIENNLLIEARGYNHGFGKVHEIALSKVFKGINTYHDLFLAYFAGKPLERLNKDGIVMDTFTRYHLLKLDTVWQ